MATEGNEELFLNEKICICLNADRKDPLDGEKVKIPKKRIVRRG